MRVTVDRLDALLSRQPETAAVFARAGGGGVTAGPGGLSSQSGVTTGAVVAVLKPDRKAKVSEIRDRLRPLLQQIPDTRLSFDSSGFGAAGVQVHAHQRQRRGSGCARRSSCKARCAGCDGLADPRPATPPSGPELVIRPRPDEAARLGVTADTIAEAARVATAGDIDANVSKLDEGERRIPIRVRLPARVTGPICR